MCSEAANGTFFDGDEQFMFTRQLKDELLVERLGKACVGDGNGNPVCCQSFRRLDAFGEPRTKRKQGDRVALHDDAAFADFKRYARFRHRDAYTVSAWVTQSAWPIVYRDGGCDHVDKLSFVSCRHDHEVG